MSNRNHTTSNSYHTIVWSPTLIDTPPTTTCALYQHLLSMASTVGIEEEELVSEKFARVVDENNDLAHFRTRFHLPTITSIQHALSQPNDVMIGTRSKEEIGVDGGESVYLCGNSLGEDTHRDERE